MSCPVSSSRCGKCSRNRASSVAVSWLAKPIYEVASENVNPYLRVAQPILAFNPDPSTIDGILKPLRVEEAGAAIRTVLREDYRVRKVTMARATLGDSQSLLAFNDLFIGRKTHISARYHLTHGRRSENQSSSGIIVSTGAGSTGWVSSVLNGAAGVVALFAATKAVAPVREGFRLAPVTFKHPL